MMSLGERGVLIRKLVELKKRNLESGNLDIVELIGVVMSILTEVTGR